MSILAEPRRRQRLSVDPQNVQWKNDDQKVSRKLMERMGWSDGDGLGRNRQGTSANVKLKANYTGKGLGADKLKSYDSTWIGHHDDFADLLSALNKNKEQKLTTEEEKEERAKKISLELNSKSLRRRIHYQKFTRAKDLSNYSENDRSAVLGIGLSKTKKESPEKLRTADESVEEKVDTSTELKSNTTVSTLSVAEYFAAKMAALKAKKDEPHSEAQADIKLESKVMIKEEEEIEGSISKERKRKRKEMKKIEERLRCEAQLETCEMKLEVTEEEEQNVEGDDEVMRIQRKRERKLKRRQERAQLENESLKESAEVVSKKARKRKEKEVVEDEEQVAEQSGDDEGTKRKKKKNKKSKQNSSE